MKSKLLLVYLLFLMSLFSQNENDWVNALIENYVNQNPDGIYDIQAIEDRLYELIENPVVLDRKRVNEIDQLFFLSPIIREGIKSHLLENGNFISIYELQTIRGIDQDLARNLSHFVRLHASEFQMNSKKFRSTITSGFQQYLIPSKAYKTGKYLGKSHRFFFRSKFKIGKRIQFGFNFEKDPGEMYWNKMYPYKVPNISGHIQFLGKKHIEKLVLGDFKLMMGQGLLIYQGYGFGKTIDLVANVKTYSGIAANTSLSENFFLRGIASELKFGKIKVIQFLSYKPISATIHQDSIPYFGSIDLSGNLKTQSDIERNQNVKEILTGTSVQYQGRKVQIGLNYLYSGYNFMYNNQAKPYQTFNLRGNAFHHASMDYKIHLKNGFLFGENAFQFHSNGFALLNGGLFSLSEKTSVLALVRYYAPNYNSIYSSGLSENTRNSNELGVLLSLQHQFTRKLKLSFYFDYFQFPWLKFNVDLPSNGFEFNSRIQYKWSRKMNAYFNFRVKSKQENSANSGTTTNSLTRFYKYQFRIHFHKKMDAKFDFSTRLEFNLTQFDQLQSGILWYFNFQYQPNLKFRLIYRFNLFSTDSFENAVYSLERNLATVNGFSVYSGEGISSYFFIKIKPIQQLGINFKFSFSHYFNQQSIGSGNEEISGSFKGYFGLEVKWSLK